MRTKIRGFSIIIFSIVFALLMTACEEPLEGLQGEQGEPGAQGQQGEHGNSPWICVDGFWHIGGTPDECDENCTGIAVGGAAGEQAQLVITKPTKTTYTACVDGVFNTAGLIVSFQHQNALIPINPVNYVLLWNDGVIENGNTAITAEAGTKTIYVIDITGRMGEFSITSTGHTYDSDWAFKTAATCIAKEVQERTCSACGDVQTQEVGEPLGHNYIYTSTTPPDCYDGFDTYTCSICSRTEQRNIVERLFECEEYGDWFIEPITSLTSTVSAAGICVNAPVCKNKSGEITGTSLEDFLSKLSENTEAIPYHLVVNINNLEAYEYGDGIGYMLLENESKYFTLDLSGSTFSGNVIWFYFLYCRNLISITLPSSVTRIETAVFSGCSSLTSITLPSSVTRIGTDAFNGCSSLTNIIIPSSVIEIYRNAFSYCSSLSSVTFQGPISANDFSDWDSFPGNLRDVFYSINPVNGTPGTYTATRTPGDNETVQWTLQP